MHIDSVRNRRDRFYALIRWRTKARFKICQRRNPDSTDPIVTRLFFRKVADRSHPEIPIVTKEETPLRVKAGTRKVAHTSQTDLHGLFSVFAQQPIRGKRISIRRLEDNRTIHRIVSEVGAKEVGGTAANSYPFRFLRIIRP